MYKLILALPIVLILGCSTPTSTNTDVPASRVLAAGEMVINIDHIQLGSEPNQPPEASVLLDPDWVIVGLGGTIYNGNFRTLKVTARKILTDGSMGPKKDIYGGSFADPAAPIEKYIGLPENAYAAVTGFTLGDHNNDLYSLGLRYRLLDPNTHRLTGSTVTLGALSGEIVFDTSTLGGDADRYVLTGLELRDRPGRITTANVWYGTLK